MKAVLTALPLLLAALAGAAPRKALLVGQQPDHPYRTHTYMDDCELIAKCLRQTPGVEAVVSRGWPSDPAALEGVSAVVVHTKLGGDLLFHKDRRDAVSRLLAGGAGLVAIHWGTGAAEPDASGLWFNAMGGWFNAQKGGFSRYKVEASKVRDVAEGHPVGRGWSDFSCRDEWYYHLRFLPASRPVARVTVAGEDHPVAWTFERPDGGRSFGFVGAHFHDNFADEPFRRLIVNGILWSLKADIPEGGAPVAVTPADLELSKEFSDLGRKK
jgi:type 1 glutamine amidotransferase